jgi:alpha-galactosidase
MLANLRKKTPDATLDDVKKPFGLSYRLMLEEVSSTLANLKTHFPDYQGQGYELAGFIWFQGWNDMVNADYTAEYAKNMANFIRDVRKDLKTPNLPFVIGQLGVGGVNEDPPNPRKQMFKDAQAAAAELPEFKGNVKVVRTDVFWDTRADAVFKKGWRENLEEWEKVGSDYPFHYLGSPHTYCQIGKALGRAVLELQRTP